MINYHNRNLWFVCCHVQGSVFFSRFVLLPPVISTLVCSVVLCVPEVRRFTGISTTVAKIYVTIIGFLLVIRTRTAFERYFNGINHVQDMFVKARDFFGTLSVFIETSISQHEENMLQGKRGPALVLSTTQKIDALRMSKKKILHWVSLFCALAVQSIQKSRDKHVDWIADITVPNIQRDFENRIHQHRQDEMTAHEESEVLAALSSNGCRDKVVADQWLKYTGRLQILGEVTQEELGLIARAQEPGNIVMAWLLAEVSELSISGKLLTEAPLLTRVYEEMSQSMCSFFGAMQIESVPFPFPFAQVIAYLINFFYLICPFIAVQIVADLDSSDASPFVQGWPSLVLNFCACTGFAAINEISVELEDPFGDDENDYPIVLQQVAVTCSMEDCYFSSMPRADVRVPEAEALDNSPPKVSPPYADNQSGISPAFRRLRSAIEVYSEELTTQGRARQTDIGTIRGHLTDLVAALDCNVGGDGSGSGG